MATKEGFIIIDGEEYTWTPSTFRRLPDKAVRKTTYETLDLKTITVIQQAPTDANVTYAENRKIHRQSWVVEWSQNAPCELETRDHVELLYQLQKPFWIQFDDEMIREGCKLRTVGEDYKAYFTPTWPIAPYGYEDVETYGGTVFINGVEAGGFTVSSELGLVRFDSALDSSDVVTMDYSWRALVRIESCDFQPATGIAQHLYAGQMVVTQVSFDSEPYEV